MRRLVSRIYRRIRGKSACGSLVTSVIATGIWESQYRSGHWDRLRQVDQVAHYGVIVGYFKYFQYGGSVLDVGCGEGILQERLGPYVYSKYVGIDLSAEAIRRASSRSEVQRTFFIRANAASYTPGESFDAIVFNESLYYFEDPLKVVKRYERWLKKDGVFIASMVENGRHTNIWRRLEAVYAVVDETKLTNMVGTSRLCKVFVKS